MQAFLNDANQRISEATREVSSAKQRNVNASLIESIREESEKPEAYRNPIKKHANKHQRADGA